MSQNVQIVISNFPEKWLVAPSDIVPLLRQSSSVQPNEQILFRSDY